MYNHLQPLFIRIITPFDKKITPHHLMLTRIHPTASIFLLNKPSIFQSIINHIIFSTPAVMPIWMTVDFIIEGNIGG